ncbi:hypothetical protein SteCoe_25348 [Stentor coeruleus]|uniref:Carbohydrate-binding module family 96 domain-containing protein n=1 Tax=Stentor coeruleus TaxID=5963 RepID=A0A1R2BFI3_9CILI|nr:hypothetical protein SteCoe_25348 [Stentor coeruleus]
MSSIKPEIALLYGNKVKYIASTILKIISIQVLFEIQSSNIYLQDASGVNYFPNYQNEFIDTNKNIFIVKVSSQLSSSTPPLDIKLESIIIDKSDSRFLYTGGTYYGGDYIFTGYVLGKQMRRTFIKFDDLSSISEKKIVKVYLRICGTGSLGYTSSAPKELFVYRVDQSYGNILKWTDNPIYNTEPEASTIVGETEEEMYSWDITSLVRGWVDKRYPNYGLMLKSNEPLGVDSGKNFYQAGKVPHIKVIYMV